jgi:nucleotide-binding universal stress UspA family protein
MSPPAQEEAMTLKDILVHVDTTRAGRDRLQLAANLAKRFDAYLTGVFVVPPPDVPVPPDAGGAAIELVSLIAIIEHEADVAEEEFSTTLKREHIRGEWHKDRGIAEPMVARRAETADLVVLGQYDAARPGGIVAPEDVVLSCGRPVLLVPYAGKFRTVGENVLVAWKETREAARALHDALPLLAINKSLLLLTIEKKRKVAEPEIDPVAHLARHGLEAKRELDRGETLDPADAILSRAADFGADMIVMGAYGHSRLREMIVGGTTRDILDHMTVPVLMSH